MPEKTMPVAHTVSPTYAKHIEDVLRQIDENAAKRLQLEGHIRRLEIESQQMVKHLSVLRDLITIAECLPQSTVPYTFSEDGKQLIGKVPLQTVLDPDSAGAHVNGEARGA